MNERFERVWDALEDTPEMAAEMRARSELLSALQLRIKSRGWTQIEAAHQLDARAGATFFQRLAVAGKNRGVGVMGD